MLKKLIFDCKHHHLSGDLTMERSEDSRDTMIFSKPESEYWKQYGIGKELMFGCREHEPGIYETGGFNFDHSMKDFAGIKPLRYARITKSGGVWIENQVEICPFNSLLNDYGVADNIEQLKEYYKAGIESNETEIVISFVTIRKEDQSKEGGWRWHKWGEYIGTQEPTMEYIADEPIIDSVICFHAYVI